MAVAAALTHGFSRGKRATSGRASQGYPARDTMPCVTQSGWRGKGHTAKKNANEVHPTDRRIPPLPRQSNSGSRSRQPPASAVGNARRDAVPREEARRVKPCPCLPNGNAVEKSTPRKKTNREDKNPLSPGGQVAAAAALTPGFSRGKRAPECRPVARIPSEYPGVPSRFHEPSNSGNRQTGFTPESCWRCFSQSSA